MKNLSAFIRSRMVWPCLLFLFHFTSAQTLNTESSGSCPNYNKFLTNDGLAQIEALSAGTQSDGTIYLDPESPENLPLIIQAMGIESGVTFEMVRETKSQLDENTVYRKFQQLYNGLEVEGGGYTAAYKAPPVGPPGNPCAEAYFLAPHVLTEIGVNPNPTISGSAIPGILNTQNISERKLVIAHNLTNQCEYLLAWRVTFEAGSAQTAWIDAQSGTIIKKVDASMHLTAPTVTYGTKNLNDQTDAAGTTWLRSPDGRIRMFAFGNCPVDPVVPSQWSTGLMPNTTNNTWTSEATPGVYQAFYVTSQLVPLYATIGVNFGNVNVANCKVANAISLRGSTVADAFILVGTVEGSLGGTTLALYDIIGHELGHTYLTNFLDGNNIGNRSLHEGISDILGTYMEFLETGTVDWAMGDDIPAVEIAFDRNLQNPDFPCLSSAPNERGQEHARGQPIGHWYYLVSQGAANGIPALGLKKPLNILQDALALIGRNADYPQLMTATLTVVLNQYGRCSDEFLAIARAWEKICVPTGYTDSDGNIPDCYTLAGPNEVCEESNYLNMCAQAGISNPFYRWRIIGQQSTGFTSVLGMQGNRQNGGDCLTLTHFPTFPYYPQYITIELYSPVTGAKYTQKRVVKILDCDGDDPTCEEYYGLALHDGGTEERKGPEHPELSADDAAQTYQFVRVFDLVGRLIYEGASEAFDPNKLEYTGIAVVVYQKNSGEIVNVKKVYLRN